MLVLVALYLQRHPDETEEGAEKALGDIEIDELGEILGQVLEFEAKNSPPSPTPEPATEAASDQPK
jgi:hypothetical protein